MIGHGSDKNGPDISSKCIGYNRRDLDFTEAGLRVRDSNPTGVCKTTGGWSSSNNDDLERTKQSNVLSEVV